MKLAHKNYNNRLNDILWVNVQAPVVIIIGLCKLLKFLASFPCHHRGEMHDWYQVQGITGSSILSKEKKLTLPSATKQNFNGMPPHCLSRSSISALDGGCPLTDYKSNN
jgi:hypothetical protein